MGTFVSHPLSDVKSSSKYPRAMIDQARLTDSLDKCAVEEVPLSPGFHSRLFVVLKASGAFHPVIDLSFLNKHVFTQVSNGNGEDGVGFHQARRLDGVSRPKGFLLASANTFSKLPIPSVWMEGSGAPVQVAVLWLFYGSPGVYQDHDTHFVSSTQKGHLPSPVPRRLVFTSRARIHKNS